MARPNSDLIELFLSYSFDHQTFVRLVYQYLRTQPTLEPYFYTEIRNTQAWNQQVKEALAKSKAFVLFLGSRLGKVQAKEINSVELYSTEHCLWVKIADSTDPEAKGFCEKLDPIRIPILEKRILESTSPEAKTLDVTDLSEADMEAAAEQCAQEIVKRLQLQWATPFDLPRGYPFDYEKNIIDAFINNGGHLSSDKVDAGCTSIWPETVKRRKEDNAHRSNYLENPVLKEIVGDYRDPDAAIVVDARAKTLQGKVQEIWEKDKVFLTFPEAGPRREVCYPLPHRNNLKVGILVSGGIAPGINAVIDGIVKRHAIYVDPPEDARRRPLYKLEVLGFVDGLMGLLHGDKKPIHLNAASNELSLKAHSGGSLLRTSREDELLSERSVVLMERIVRRLTEGTDKVDILYVIGGDGSMRAAHAIYTMAKRAGADLSVVSIPKTMDNDILWVWQSFGFLSAVERAKEAILQLHVEASSNPRLCVIQLFGSDSGFVASHAALTSGVCDYVLIPEVGFKIQTLIERMIKKLETRYESDESPYGVIVMAETAIPRDYKDYYETEEVGLSAKEREAVDDFVLRKGRVHGQTPDRLRSAALKIVSGSLQAAIRKIEVNNDYWSRYRVFANEPRHLIRAIPPSTADVIFGERLGTLAVDGAMAGYSDCMVSQWLTEYVLVPLKLVVLGRKRVPPKGIFWRTVLANTGQPDEDLPPWSE